MNSVIVLFFKSMCDPKSIIHC